MSDTTITPMMACGHAANSVHVTPDGARVPSCVICSCDEPAAESIDLSERTAVCCYCKRTAPSSTRLAYFGHRPGQEHDSFYDGCRGWS